ncbi:self-protective colicin-like immunity protein [Haloactinospora alba]|uniref:Self-protective colicin-like immunity protein n=1 Tax=Haloactinospora alba TaxID=405555 RepID=A0A543NLU7_9ACTN|nr:colicin immunity domain-containing protein [Haloactinospora alba]TQN32815.1 self-protective colicin-like immunity protein [Haloactinospora alba]
MSSAPVAPYVELCRQFVRGGMTASCFESLFLVMYKSEMRELESHYSDMAELFWAVDAYCPDPDIRDSSDLDEEQLRSAARGFVEAVQGEV